MLKLVPVFSWFLLLTTVVHCSKFYSCSWILSPWVDCNGFGTDENCGTNVVTYKNKCEFSQAHCLDGTIDLLHSGACNSLDQGATTPTPQNGAQVIQDFLCTGLSHRDCPQDLTPVCGSDGWTYQNFCEFEKTKCTHRDLHVRAFADCQAKY